MKPPRVLIVAGSDSGGGGGIQADIKTVTMLGGHAMTAITAITAQNTVGVQDVFPLPDGIVQKQIGSVLDDLGVDAVKIGMLGTPNLVQSVRDSLYAVPPGTPIVLDPVMVATSGDALNEKGTGVALCELAGFATLITPNVPELEALTGCSVRSESSMADAAQALAKAFGCPVLAKGGHLEGETLVDLLTDESGVLRRWENARIDTPHTHGTGCTLASAVATGLGAGLKLDEAIEAARLFVRIALRDAPGLGAGHGPMGQQCVRLDLPDREGPTLNHVTLPASDYEASVAFYRLIGSRQIVAAPPRYARFEVPGGMTLSIEVRDPPDPPSSTEHFFQCADVDAEAARLAAAGVAFEVVPEDRDYLWRVAEAQDPHGNRIRLYSTGEIRRFPPWRID